MTGTLDELEPQLRALGFTAAITMAGPIDLSALDPYGMRRVGSVNIRTEKWAHHVYRGVLEYRDGKAYLADAVIPDAGSPFLRGAYELI